MSQDVQTSGDGDHWGRAPRQEMRRAVQSPGAGLAASCRRGHRDLGWINPRFITNTAQLGEVPDGNLLGMYTEEHGEAQSCAAAARPQSRMVLDGDTPNFFLLPSKKVCWLCTNEQKRKQNQ